MAAKVSLSVKQQKFLTALLTPHPIVLAAKVAGISEQTAHRWLKQETFQLAYQEAKDKLFEDALDELKIGMCDAIKALKKHVGADVEPTAATQLAAVRIWVEQGVALHKMSEFEEKYALLEQIVKDSGLAIRR